MSNNRVSLLEAIGIIGVFARLLLVAYELRQNSIAAQGQTRATLTVIAHDMIQSVSTPKMSEIIQKVERDETLNESEQYLFRMNRIMQFRIAENVFYQHRIGTFTEEEFTGYRNFYKNFFSDYFTLDAWDNSKDIFSPTFQQEIETLISEIK